ncbi:MAG: hypothetical protein GY860_11640 [Desulfobacteraceae bacterium]|nr:hypothetical protein [Desulfobacteraceae bacterium]
MTPSVETQGMAFLRQLNLKTIKSGITQVNCLIPREVAYYILNKKREELIEIESKRNVSITIEIDPEMVSGESRITGNI